MQFWLVLCHYIKEKMLFAPVLRPKAVLPRCDALVAQWIKEVKRKACYSIPTTQTNARCESDSMRKFGLKGGSDTPPLRSNGRYTAADPELPLPPLEGAVHAHGRRGAGACGPVCLRVSHTPGDTCGTCLNVHVTTQPPPYECQRWPRRPDS